MRRKGRGIAAAITVLGVVVGNFVGAPTSVAEGRHSPTITTFISGLNAPRGLAVDGQGNLYVSESGSAGPGPLGLADTGKVSKYPRGSSTAAWSTGFQTLYDASHGSPDVLGLGDQRARQGLHQAPPSSQVGRRRRRWARRLPDPHDHERVA